MVKEVNSLNGWLIIDKPVDMGSTQVVSKLKWLLKPSKIGHAGTLDPLAEGVLPIALGKATRLIPYVMDGRKVYEFDISFGSETETDDLEGAVTQISAKRPTQTEVEAVLPEFIGTILQTPPAYSALKINGQRAYDMARKGQEVHLTPRPIQIEALTLIQFTSEKARFRVVCGKGTYVRSLGRDIGRKLGCLGHISYLRRTVCGPFYQDASISLAKIEKIEYDVRALSILPLETALDDILVLAIERCDAQRLVSGLSVRQPNNFQLSEKMTQPCVFKAMFQNRLVALVKYEEGVFKPFRVFLDKIV